MPAPKPAPKPAAVASGTPVEAWAGRTRRNPKTLAAMERTRRWLLSDGVPVVPVAKQIRVGSQYQAVVSKKAQGSVDDLDDEERWDLIPTLTVELGLAMQTASALTAAAYISDDELDAQDEQLFPLSGRGVRWTP